MISFRTIRSRLTLWHVCLISVVFIGFGIHTYWLTRTHVLKAQRQNLIRRADQIATMLLKNISQTGEHDVIETIETRYSPHLSNRFLRITRPDGSLLYLSSAPENESFDPAKIPHFPKFAPLRELSTPTSKIQIISRSYTTPEGATYVIEHGTSEVVIDNILHELIHALAIGIPALILMTGLGGWFLMKRAMSPVDAMISAAEQISLKNLSRRLPNPHTDDEVERLSTVLNGMIQRLNESYEHMSRFSMDASHELRTPLTILRGEIESLIHQGGLPPDLREPVSSMLEECERLSKIVEGLFAITRLEMGSASMEMIPFDFGALVRTTAEHMEPLALEKSLKLSWSNVSDCLINGDRHRLKQVIVNLIDNAIKYTASGGDITLRLRMKGHRAMLEISDTGIGVSPASLPHVFERFYRCDKVRSRSLGGAGLGLSIVRSIVLAHNGLISVESREGKGSCFRLELPCTAKVLVRS